MTLYDMLCVNQTTGNIVVDPLFRINIRFSTIILVLRTQVDECRINQTADLPGICTVWFYPNGMANIL